MGSIGLKKDIRLKWVNILSIYTPYKSKMTLNQRAL